MNVGLGRVFVYLLGVTLIVLSVGGAALLAVVATERGTALAAATVARHAPLAFDFARLEGSLAGGLRIEGLRLATPAVRIAVATLDWRWRPRALLTGWFDIERLALDDVTVERLPTDEPEAAGPPGLPRVPVAVRLRALEVTALTVHDGAEPLALARLAAALELTPGRFTLSDLAIEHAAARVEGEGTFEAGRKPSVTARLAAQVPGVAPDLALRVELAGPVRALRMTGQVTGPAQIDFSGTLDAAAAVPRATLTAELARLDIGAAATPHHIGPVQLALDGTPHALRLELRGPLALHEMAARAAGVTVELVHEPATAVVSGEFTWQLEAPADDAFGTLAGTGSVRYADAVLALRHVSAAPYPTTLSAEVHDLTADPRLTGTLTADPLTLVLDDDASSVLELAALELRAAGTRAQLHLDGGVRARETRLGPFAFEFAGTLDEATTLRVRTVTGRLLDGTLAGDGELRLTPALAGRLELALRALDLAPLVAGLDTRLDADTALGVRAGADGIAADVTLMRLAGTWRGAQVSGRGRLAYAPARYTVDALELGLGDNRLRLSATLDDRLDGHFELAAPTLATLAPAVRGRLAAHGVLSGSVQEPALVAELEGADLGFATWSIARADGQVDLDLGRATEQRLSFVLDDVREGTTRHGRVTTQLGGRPDAHVLELRLDDGPARAQLRANGAWDAASWRGHIDELRLERPRFGRWTLQRAAALSYAAQTVQLAPLCLEEVSAATLCLEVPDWSAAAGSAAFALTGLPLAQFGPLLPTTLGAEGLLDAEVNMTQQGEQRRAHGRVQVHAGELAVTLDDVVERLAISAAAADFTLENDTLAATLRLVVERWLSADGSLTLGLGDDATLQAEVSAAASALDWIEQFLPDLAGSRGAASLSLQATGTLTAPRLAFDLALDKGSLLVQPSGMRLTTLHLAGRMVDTHELRFDGSLGNADGSATVGGALTLDAAAGWPGHVTVRGERLAAVRLPEAEADLAPDLRIGFGPAGIDLNGSVGLPRVKVDIKQLPESAVAVSPDEVLIGPERTAADAEPGSDFFIDAVTGQVDVTLGDDVWITAAGLRARLTGGLRWTKARGQSVGRGEGRVSIAEGGYKAYGQNLGIERGHLTFAGAIDNPALDVRAVRRDIDIVAGVMVTGDVRRPKFDLFSEPALPDSDILAYIITGRALDNASSGDAGMIARAALSLGAERSSMVTSRVQDAFGLDELSINTGATAEQTALTAGKRLTPKLSVRSEFNPFDRLWSFFLNYKLTEQWSVEGESGARQGADVIYSIEREELLPPGWWGGD